ncbi:MAG: hypothetical protein H0V40_05355 [Actinobacteria bacterium]|nr:hypothetical protein [Actinomycetota bacterium]
MSRELELTEPRPTPLGAAGRGLAAGIVGTAVMTAYQEAKSRLSSDSGESEDGGDEGEQTWEDAPEPAKIGKRISEGMFKRKLSSEHIDLTNTIVHWAYGTGWGMLYGLTQGTARGRVIPRGLLFGTAVWGSAYVLLPAMKLYKPLWKYPPSTLAADWAQHAVYGLGVAAGYRAIDPA